MENNREKWIDEVLNSTQGMHRAQPGDGLYERVIIKAGRQIHVLPFRATQWAAAAIILLVLNVGSVLYATSRDKSTATAHNDNPLAMELQSSSTYNY